MGEISGFTPKTNIQPKRGILKPASTAVNTGAAVQGKNIPSAAHIKDSGVKNVKTIKDTRGTLPQKSDPKASEGVVNAQGNAAEQVSGEKIEKTRKVLQKVKDNISLVDIKVADKNIVIDKPWPMEDSKIPIRDGKTKEAGLVVNDLTKKFKADQNPTAQDSVRVLNVVDQEKLMAMLKN